MEKKQTKIDRANVPSYGCYAMIGQSLVWGGLTNSHLLPTSNLILRCSAEVHGWNPGYLITGVNKILKAWKIKMNLMTDRFTRPQIRRENMLGVKTFPQTLKTALYIWKHVLCILSSICHFFTSFHLSYNSFVSFCCNKMPFIAWFIAAEELLSSKVGSIAAF